MAPRALSVRAEIRWRHHGIAGCLAQLSRLAPSMAMRKSPHSATQAVGKRPSATGEGDGVISTRRTTSAGVRKPPGVASRWPLAVS